MVLRTAVFELLAMKVFEKLDAFMYPYLIWTSLESEDYNGHVQKQQVSPGLIQHAVLQVLNRGQQAVACFEPKSSFSMSKWTV